MGRRMKPFSLIRAAAIATIVVGTTFATSASANPFFLFGQPF